MPLKVTIQIGPNTFTADGDFAFDEGFASTFKAWVNAQQSEAPGALDQVTDTLEQQSAALKAAVEQHTPPA